MGCQQVRPQDADLLPACGDDALLPETGKISGEIDPVGRKDIRQLLLAQINDWARLCLLSFCQEIEEVFAKGEMTEEMAWKYLGRLIDLQIEAALGNPNYYSENGILYTSAGEVVAAPVWYGDM